jgi:hypothetical protein
MADSGAKGRRFKSSRPDKSKFATKPHWAVIDGVGRTNVSRVGRAVAPAYGVRRQPRSPGGSAMDVLSWFRSVVLRARSAPAPLRADLATEAWPDVPPPRPVVVVSRPPAANAGEDDDWDAAIGRARLAAASPNARSPQLPPPSGGASRKVSSPPPLPPEARALPKAASPAAPRDAQAKARMDALLWGGMKKPTARRAKSRR